MCFLRLLCFLLFSCSLSAQSSLAIGQWATHLPYNNGNHVTESEHFVYYSTSYSILKINKSDLSYERLSRTEGLSGSLINNLYFHKPSGTLVIAYLNGILDLLDGNGIRTVVDIFNFSNIPIDKNPNKIRFLDDEHILICSNFGLSQLHIPSGTFNFTLFTPNIKVNDCVRDGSLFYMATETGLYRFDDNGKNIIQNFGSWIKLGSNEGLPSSSSFNSVELFDQLIYASTENAVFKKSASDFELFFEDPAYSISYLKSGPFHLLTSAECNQSCASKIFFFDKVGNKSASADGCADQNLDAVECADGRVWYADVRWSFRFSNTSADPCNSIWVNGPLSNRAFEIAALTDGIYVATGGVDATFTPNYSAEGIAKYANNNWSLINSFTEPQLSSFNLTDVIRILESSASDKIYFASSGKGLLEYDKTNSNYKLYNKTNSPLKGTVGDTGNVRLSGLAFDRKGSLWITNYLAPVGLLSLSKDGQWKNYSFPNNPNLFTEVKVDQNGYKWIVTRLNGGVLVFDEGDPDNPSDDRSIQLTTSNTEMTTNDVRTIEVDLEGDVWVGTAEGPVVFECGSSIFSGQCKGSRRKVDQDGIVFFLLSSEVITSIAVDGANRKWFGTNNNGVYVQSPTGEVQVYNFNTTNSPLIDNNITDIAIHPKTGEVWIGTLSGIQVFRSEATSGRDLFSSEVLVFPNPVPQDYVGPIAINGLARDARFKVTDLSGRLVYESFANGAQAIWDGKDYLGRKVASGVYLVFANSTQDFESSVGLVSKIIITR